MSKKVMVWLIVAASLILSGSIIFGGVMMALNWDFTKLSTFEYETNEYEITDNYKNITVKTDTAKIKFVKSEATKVVCIEQRKFKHLVTVKDDTLIIELTEDKKWYDNIGINIGSPQITVYIPEGEYGALTVNGSTSDTELPKDFKFESINITQSTGYVKCFASVVGDLKIKTSTGYIELDNITAGSVSLKVTTGNIKASMVECVGDFTVNVSTGKAKLENVKCNDILSTGSTGDIELINVIANEIIDIKRSTGDIKFDGCDSGELIITTDTGDVKGTLLSDKVFIVKTDTGSVEVPETIKGGKCKITTDTGDIKIEIQK